MTPITQEVEDLKHSASFRPARATKKFCRSCKALVHVSHNHRAVVQYAARMRNVNAKRPGGYIAGACHLIGVGRVIAAQPLYERTGFTGEYATPYPQKDKSPDDRVVIALKGRRIYRTAKAAIAAYKAGKR